VNIGLMMLASGSGSGGSGIDGAYVRFHMRQMTATNKAALIELIGTDSCVDGPNSLNGTPNCIYKNYDGSEKVSTGAVNYSTTLFEAYKYLGGYTNPANALTNTVGGTFTASTYGPLRYSVIRPRSTMLPLIPEAQPSLGTTRPSMQTTAARPITSS
jgi:hypothetical protein